MDSTVPESSLGRNVSCCFREPALACVVAENAPAIPDVLAEVGPRLKRLRTGAASR
jgi:hypothetical protein